MRELILAIILQILTCCSPPHPSPRPIALPHYDMLHEVEPRLVDVPPPGAKPLDDDSVADALNRAELAARQAKALVSKPKVVE